MLEIYKRIRARREELGISQEELAKRMGYRSRSSINKIENGEDKEKVKKRSNSSSGMPKRKTSGRNKGKRA
jgi:transcriptional regulator